MCIHSTPGSLPRIVNYFFFNDAQLRLIWTLIANHIVCIGVEAHPSLLWYTGAEIPFQNSLQRINLLISEARHQRFHIIPKMCCDRIKELCSPNVQFGCRAGIYGLIATGGAGLRVNSLPLITLTRFAWLIMARDDFGTAANVASPKYGLIQEKCSKIVFFFWIWCGYWWS